MTSNVVFCLFYITQCLLDQTDYVVVGCVGMQAAGKSTLMSLLAGQSIDSIEKT